MPAAGTRTSSSRIVVSGSLRWPPAAAGCRRGRSLRRGCPGSCRAGCRRGRRLRRRGPVAVAVPAPAAAVAPAALARLVVLAVLVLAGSGRPSWFWSCWRVLLLAILVLLLAGCPAAGDRPAPAHRGSGPAGGRGPAGCPGPASPGCGPGRSRFCCRGASSAGACSAGACTAAAWAAGACSAGAGGWGACCSVVACFLGWRWRAGRCLTCGADCVGAGCWPEPRSRRAGGRRTCRPTSGCSTTWCSTSLSLDVLLLDVLAPADWLPGDWAALIASTSCAFFMEPAPAIPMPAAMDFRSAISMELSPPPRFFGAPVWASGAAVVESMVSVT